MARKSLLAQLPAMGAILLALCPIGLSAQEPASNGSVSQPEPSASPPPAGLEGGTAARMLNPVIPKYPSAARSRGQEGWVQLSFSVKPDGTVADPIVEDSSGIDKFEQAAIKSILATRYAPATWNGKPVEQCAAKMMYHFTIAGDNKGARPAFISDYRAAVDLVTEKRVAEAEAKLDEMTQKGAWNNYESSRLWLMRAALQYEKGDRVGQLKSLRRSTLGGGMYLEPKIYRNTLRTIFALETSDRQFGAALSTYEKLKKFFPPLAPLDEAALDKIATEIQDVIDGPDTLGFPGVIEYRSGCEEGRPNWKHELLRRKFAFSDIQGKLDKFEVRCDWKRVVDDVSTDKTWEIPQSWGWCQVFVFGDLGSRVKLLEYPLAESQKKVRLTPITIE